MKAIWNNMVLAESDNGVVVEGNYYFPPESISDENFRQSALNTVCGWKGTASYYDLIVGSEVSENAAWYYPEPKDAAAEIKNYVAFYRDRVDVVKE